MPSIQTRVTNILTKPADEWRVIAVEPATVQGLLRDYAAPLAAIPAVCQFIGFSFVGVFGFRIGLVQGLTGAVLTWVLTLVGAWISAIVIEKLAPTFQSSGTTTQALKMVVYANTPVWVAGVLNIIPGLGVLVIIAAIYAIYLFYLGLPVVMATPADKIIPYMVVSAIVIIIVSIVLGTITAAISGIGAFRAF